MAKRLRIAHHASLGELRSDGVGAGARSDVDELLGPAEPAVGLVYLLIHEPRGPRGGERDHGEEQHEAPQSLHRRAIRVSR